MNNISQTIVTQAMLQNVSPHRTRSSAGSLSSKEKTYVKALADKGYVVQDIAFILNQGRSKTVNQSVVQLAINGKTSSACEDNELNKYLKIQSCYDPKTLLNPHKDERLMRARESMISAVQIFNSPAIQFKTEIFCVLANIAWTYLMHEKMERTTAGSSSLPNGNTVTVGGTLDKDICPIKNPAVVANLKEIIKIRDAVEHTFFVGGEECFGALFQSCCINFESHLTDWFGEHVSLTKELSLALQFRRLQKNQIIELEVSDLPAEIAAISKEIHNSQFANDPAFNLKVFFTTEATSKTKADIHRLVAANDATALNIVAIKKLDYTLLSQDDVVKRVNAAGFRKFTGYHHQQFWKTKWLTSKQRNRAATEYGKAVLKNQWLWYEQTWLPMVLEHCTQNGAHLK